MFAELLFYEMQKKDTHPSVNVFICFFVCFFNIINVFRIIAIHRTHFFKKLPLRIIHDIGWVGGWYEWRGKELTSTHPSRRAR